MKFKTLDTGSLYYSRDDGEEFDTSTKLSREQLNTLHDYCLFKKSSECALNRQFYLEELPRLEQELKELSLDIPSKILHVYGASYPGSRSFAAEVDGKLIFT